MNLSQSTRTFPTHARTILLRMTLNRSKSSSSAKGIKSKILSIEPWCSQVYVHFSLIAFSHAHVYRFAHVCTLWYMCANKDWKEEREHNQVQIKGKADSNKMEPNEPSRWHLHMCTYTTHMCTYTTAIQKSYPVNLFLCTYWCAHIPAFLHLHTRTHTIPVVKSDQTSLSLDDTDTDTDTDTHRGLHSSTYTFYLILCYIRICTHAMLGVKSDQISLLIFTAAVTFFILNNVSFCNLVVHAPVKWPWSFSVSFECRNVSW